MDSRQRRRSTKKILLAVSRFNTAKDGWMACALSSGVGSTLINSPNGNSSAKYLRWEVRLPDYILPMSEDHVEHEMFN